GNTYLLNLTFPSKLHNVRKLSGIFKASPAPYKLLSTENFVLFSPECFVRISGNHIYSFPMKGTIDAGIPNAEELILQNKKEYFEHNTIVDLIRNDLSVVSHNIAVPRFRFIDRLKTSNKELLQVSSQIRGELPENWHKNIGDILLSLLPAGSVSGAPKAKTIEIIRESEKQDRGFFTGIFGIFNGDSLESGVNIRFIEQTKNGFFFRSGGGITALSTMDEEYEEMINKVYVPLA
ncbi:MAG: aminodeoxychorismate synthase component I, partial [Bacteroidales bacterium]